MSPPLQRTLRGIVPPMITPLLERDKVDVESLERLIAHLMRGGVHGLFILGTTGEGPALSYRLRREVITHTCKIVGQKLPVLVGISDTSAVESVQLAHHAADAGAAVLVFTTPYYYPISQDELFGYVKRLVPQLPLPAMLYNMPRMTKVSFEEETLRRLADEKKVVGVKDSCGDLAYFEKLVAVAKARPDWSVFVGPERLLVDTVKRGGSGGVNGGSNIWPRLLVDLYDAAVKSDERRIAELQSKLTKMGQIYSSVQQASSLVKGLKCALSVMGICRNVVSEPFTPCTEAELQRGREILSELGLLDSGNR